MSIPAYINWNPSPEIFDLGFYALRWYSILFLSGFVLSFIILKGRFIKAGLDLFLLEKLTIYVILGTLIGARLGHCFFYDWDYYSKHIPEIFLPFQFKPTFRLTGFQGLASHGGGIGIFIALILYNYRYKNHVNLLWILDQLALVVPLAGCCIRMGNLMNSEIIGKPTHVSWAFIFIQNDGIPRHPAQLYETMAYLSIFIVLHQITRSRSSANGFIFGLFLVLIFTARLLLETLKADQADFEAHMALNMGQLLSIPFIITGIIVMLLKRKKPRSLSMPGVPFNC